MNAPSVVVLAGPNGAGKTTSAAVVLPDVLGVRHFVNADVIASGLSAFDPEVVAIAAGRLMLTRMRELAEQRESFGFETTLASRSFAPFLRNLAATGYGVHLVYLWLPDPELAIARVARRVLRGGHRVPDDVVRRRYWGGLRNFLELYQPLATTWRFYDNSGERPIPVAYHLEGEPQMVVQPELWVRILREVQRP